jgi:hypothetical protein
MTDAIVVTCYRSPRSCEARVKLLKSLDPESLVFIAYTGDPGRISLFRRVFAAADAFYEVPTANTKDNWYGLDRALLGWWTNQGKFFGLTRILLLDWDVLLLDPPVLLLDQLSEGQVLFSHVFPVLDLDSDHWAREFVESNSLDPLLFMTHQHRLSRAFLFAWACFASDLEKVVDCVASMNGYCEVRLPYAFQSNGVRLGSFSGLCLELCHVLGQGVSLASLRRLQMSPSYISMAHPVYLPISSQSFKLDPLAFLLEAPYLKTLARHIKQSIRLFLVSLGLFPRLNPK